MTDDIIERIDKWAKGDDVEWQDELLRDAKDEIARLRAQVRYYELGWSDKQQEMEAEIERLRAALQEIARADCWTVDNSGIEISHDELCTLSREFNVRANLADPHHYRINEWLKRQISRRALKSKP